MWINKCIVLLVLHGAIGMRPPKDGAKPYFEYDEEKMTCDTNLRSEKWGTLREERDPYDEDEQNLVYGVNLGGWMVLEPWVTPSLFYQFLGKDQDKVAMDTYSFCQALGPKEGNRQLRRHWKTWVTHDNMLLLAEKGINALRIPVGDWMFGDSYGPYTGCFDGSLEYLDKALNWAQELNMSVLFDLHAMKGSANGLDNGGITVGLAWTSTLQDVAPNAKTFEHWPRRTANWMGTFDPLTATYPEIDHDNIERSLQVIENITLRYHKFPAAWGIEPVNEPWQYTPMTELKRYYFEGYLRIKKIAPKWRYVMHDSFRLDPAIWGDFMMGCPDKVLDAHIYSAWFDPSDRYNFYINACGQANLVTAAELAFGGPVIVGEWSLATDNCAMWLNGFNDNLPGYPKLPCKFVPCAAPYMGAEQPDAPPSSVKGLQGPFGTGVSGPMYGQCPSSRDWRKYTPGDLSPENSRLSDLTDLYAYTAPEDDDTNTVMTTLAAKKMAAFSSHGWFFWNFRTENDDQWSYTRAVDRNWFLDDPARLVDIVGGSACASEDAHCHSNPLASDAQVREALNWVTRDALPETHLEIDQIKDPNALRGRADYEFEKYWVAHRSQVASGYENAVDACHFGGAAILTTSVYKCVSKRVDEKATRDAMSYCVNYDPDALKLFDSLHGEDLWQQADEIFEEFWQLRRYAGVTCDFGGGAQLLVDRDILNKDEDNIVAAVSQFNTKRRTKDISGTINPYVPDNPEPAPELKEKSSPSSGFHAQSTPQSGHEEKSTEEKPAFLQKARDWCFSTATGTTISLLAYTMLVSVLTISFQKGSLSQRSRQRTNAPSYTELSPLEVTSA